MDNKYTLEGIKQWCADMGKVPQPQLLLSPLVMGRVTWLISKLDKAQEEIAELNKLLGRYYYGEIEKT